MINIALIGNPNSGKTTMFNNLTGSTQYIGNWPGVTVEKKTGKIKNKKDINIIDLPGIYSLSPYTQEEMITRDYIINDKPDVIINILDSSNIERNLYLTTQLLELGIPVVIALNMTDILKKRGDILNKENLYNELGCEVIETTALNGEGLNELIEKAVICANSKKLNKQLNIFSEDVIEAIHNIEIVLKVNNEAHIDEIENKWNAIKIFERDKKVLERLRFTKNQEEEINTIIKNVEQKLNDESESIIINERYLYISSFISNVIKKANKNRMTVSDKIDLVITNKYLAIPIFIFVMFLIYYISVNTLGAIVTDWTNDVFFGEYVSGAISTGLTALDVSPWVHSLVIDGIVAGIGAILGFLPQMFILFLLLTLLEECGYMARVAFIMDRLFRKFGLSGKSFIPMLISSGCGVPGIMASRTIESEKDKKITIMVTTFIPCGAKLPIIALFVAALFPENIFIAPSVYFVTILSVVISGIILKKMKAFAGDVSPFIMELPNYHIPSPKNLAIHITERLKSFVLKAGAIIFIASIVLWVLSNLNFKLDMVSPDESILAFLGGLIAPIFKPLGFGDWRSAVATINGFIAKENLVSTYGVLLGVDGEGELNSSFITKISELFTPVSAYSFVMFNMLCAPCFAAIGSIKREMMSWKWTLITVGFQTLVAYIVSYIIYNMGNALVLDQISVAGISISMIIIIGILYLIFRKNKYI